MTATDKTQALAEARRLHPRTLNLQVCRFERANWGTVYNWLGWRWANYDLVGDAPMTLRNDAGQVASEGDWLVRTGVQRKRFLAVIKNR